MKLLKLSAALISICFFASCASKTKTETAAPVVAKTEVAPVKSAETKTAESKKSTKKVKATAAVPKATTAAASSEATCKAGAEERKLAIQAKDAGCELQYTKAGETKTIASQITGNEKCEEVMTKVKANLTAAGYDCK